jgi:hypothetical protein
LELHRNFFVGCDLRPKIQDGAFKGLFMLQPAVRLLRACADKCEKRKDIRNKQRVQNCSNADAKTEEMKTYTNTFQLLLLSWQKEGRLEHCNEFL